MSKHSYERNITVKCLVCKHDVLIDQYGNGVCVHCGWEQSDDGLDFPDIVRYPNLVSYNKAKQLYEDGKPFVPTIEDFMGGLFFYSEMQFYYNSKRYGVIFGKELTIHFYEWNVMEESYQIYKTKEEFIANANIKGILLKDIWEQVDNPEYMVCD